MRRNLYIASFVAILLIACVGGFVGGRVLLARLQGDFAPRGGESPAPTQIAQAGATVAPTPTEPAGQTEDLAPTQPLPTSTVMVVAAPVTDQPALFTPEPTWTAGIELPTLEFQTPEGTPTVDEFATSEPSATAIPAYPFVLARSVRYSSNDCPGTYAQGQVIDRSGSPLPGIRLRLIDEYGNAATAATKPGPGDTGRYDFPMGGPPRKFYMSIIDDAGRSLSPEVEILHDLAPQAGKNCRWVDWRRTY